MRPRPYLLQAYIRTPNREGHVAEWHRSRTEALATQAELETLGWAVTVTFFPALPAARQGKTGLLSGRMTPR